MGVFMTVELSYFKISGRRLILFCVDGKEGDMCIAYL